jgi:hypothetical protein
MNLFELFQQKGEGMEKGKKYGQRDKEMKIERFVRDSPLSFQRAFFFLAPQQDVCLARHSILCNSLSNAFRRQLLISNTF